MGEASPEASGAPHDFQFELYPRLVARGWVAQTGSHWPKLIESLLFMLDLELENLPRLAI